MEYVAAVDQGTTSTRVILFDSNGQPVCSHSLEHKTFRPHPGWEEHDPVEILNNVKACIDGCVEIATTEHNIEVSQIKAFGITNQRETTVVWDKTTGKPLYNAIVWQDNRTHATCEELKSKIPSEAVRELTGLPISTYFSGVKLKWMVDNVAPVRDAMADGTMLFGTVDTWLVWNISKTRRHVTDVTNAGRTMLMNVRSLQWDKRMVRVLGVPEDVLPAIISSSEVVDELCGTRLAGVPISGMIGDQQAALLGQCCFSPGEAKATYGTGCFLIINTGTTPRRSSHGLLTTPAYQLGPDAPVVYSLEGAVAVAGSAITWMRDALALVDSAEQAGEVAASVSDTAGVYCVPAFTGLYAPWWRDDARGTLVGITQYSTRAHVVRAILESIPFTVHAVLQAAALDMRAPVAQLKVDGGVSRSELVMQMQADIINTTVVRPKIIETTALGAALCAGRAVSLYQSLEHFKQCWQLDSSFAPKIGDAERQEKLRLWNKAVEKSLGWADQSPDCVPRSGLSPWFQRLNLGSTKFWVGVTTGICISYIAVRTLRK